MSQSEAFSNPNCDLIVDAFGKRPLERLTGGCMTSTQQQEKKRPQKAIQRIINEISVNISEMKYLTADDDKKKIGFVSANKGKNVTFKLTSASERRVAMHKLCDVLGGFLLSSMMRPNLAFENLC